MRQLAPLLRQRTFIALFAVLILWGGFTAYEDAVAPQRLDPVLRQAMEEGRPIGRIGVNLDFAPEEFHINRLQDYGALAGVEGKTLYLVQVRPSDIRELSKLYWIRSIDLAD